jgi:hypothetical protein
MTQAETPMWVTYGADIFFLALFLIVFFFMKPSPDSEKEGTLEEGEEPNPLEKVLVTENTIETTEESDSSQKAEKDDFEEKNKQ